MFTTFESETICLLYLLDICFNQIEIFKPATSKEGNSEVYVICLDFQSSDWLQNFLKETKVFILKITVCPSKHKHLETSRAGNF